MVNIDDYSEVKDCIYKDEHYSARDNGAVIRQARVYPDSLHSYLNPAFYSFFTLITQRHLLYR